jgi:hypothetical protein
MGFGVSWVRFTVRRSRFAVWRVARGGIWQAELMNRALEIGLVGHLGLVTTANCELETHAG